MLQQSVERPVVIRKLPISIPARVLTCRFQRFLCETMRHSFPFGRYATTFCLLVCVVMIRIAAGAPRRPEVVIRGLPHVICTSPLSYYLDRSRVLSFNQVKDKTFSGQTRELLSAINEYDQHANYWMRFALDNLDSLPVTAYLDAGYFSVVHVYEIQSGRTKVQNGGIAQRKDISTSPPELNAIKLVIPPRTTIRYFVCAFSTPDYGSGLEQVNISSKESHYAAFYRDYYESKTFRFLQILFFGFMLSQMLYVAFSRVIGIKRKEYLFYLFYLILVTSYFFLRYNSDIGIYWPFEYYPSIRGYLKSVLLALPYLFYLKFVRYFLDLSELDRKIFERIIYLERFILIYVIADTSMRFILSSPDVLNEILMVTIMGIFVYCLILIIRLMRYKRVFINLILTGSLVAAVGGGIGILITFFQNDIGILHTNLNALLAPQVGIFLETIIFTTSLSYKSRVMEIEKVEDQKKLIAQMEENAALKEKMEQTRNKIAQDLHDDIGSTLSSILLFSNAAKSKILFGAGEAHEIFGRISEIAGAMMDEMSDIIWTINPRQDSMDQILKRMHYYAAPLALARNMKFHFKVDEDIRHLYLSMEKRKNLFLIFKESVINALKYSEAATLRVTFYRADSCLHMLVQDDGKGFSRTSGAGNGLDNMKARAEAAEGILEISTLEDQGTTVHLALPL